MAVVLPPLAELLNRTETMRNQNRESAAEGEKNCNISSEENRGSDTTLRNPRSSGEKSTNTAAIRATEPATIRHRREKPSAMQEILMAWRWHFPDISKSFDCFAMVFSWFLSLHETLSRRSVTFDAAGKSRRTRPREKLSWKSFAVSGQERLLQKFLNLSGLNGRSH